MQQRLITRMNRLFWGAMPALLAAGLSRRPDAAHAPKTDDDEWPDYTNYARMTNDDDTASISAAQTHLIMRDTADDILPYAISAASVEWHFHF